MKMKSLKTQFIGAIAMVLVAAIAMGSSTYAWFSLNKRVTATDMKVHATTSQSLVISKEANVATLTTVDFKDVATTALTPTTHMDTFTNPGAASATTTTNYLAHITNGADVSAATGYADSYVYADSVNDNSNTYYKDFTVFIAAAGGALTGQDLFVSFDDGTISAIGNYVDVTNDTRKATTVDFYVKVLSETNQSAANSATFAKTDYKAKLDFAHCQTNSAPTTVKLLDNVSIPQNGANTTYIKVLMRVYIDGALAKTEVNSTPTQAYVYTDTVDISDAVVGVAFTCADHPTT